MNVLSKNPFNFHRIVLTILFILSNLLFFQPTQAQLNNPFSGFTCGDTTICPWINDSLMIKTPGPNDSCFSKLYYKHRICYGTLELQPTAIFFNGTGYCDTSNMFYGDTLYNQRIEQLLKTGELRLVEKYWEDYWASLTGNERSLHVAQTNGVSVWSQKRLLIIFRRPACRGICIQYNRANSSSPITSIYAKWYNCTEDCCEIESYLAYKGNIQVPTGYFHDGNYVRVQWAYNSNPAPMGCSTEPAVSCPLMTNETSVIRFKNCRNYCVDSLGVYGPDHHDPYGIPHFDKSKSGIYNLDEQPFLTEHDFATIPNDLLLESTNNEIIIQLSNGLVSVKIISIEGVELQKTSINSGNSYQIVSLKSLQNGLYLLVFETKNGITTKPLIIAK